MAQYRIYNIDDIHKLMDRGLPRNEMVQMIENGKGRDCLDKPEALPRELRY